MACCLPSLRFCALALIAIYLCASFNSSVHAQDDSDPEIKTEQKSDNGAVGEGMEQLEGQIVQRIDVRGQRRINKMTILRLIRTRVGRPFNRQIWDEDWHRLTESGYFRNVRTTPPIRYLNGVLLAIELVEKPTIKEIAFEGNKAIKSSELTTIITSNVGGRFENGQVFQDARAIEKKYRDEAFRDITVTYEVKVVSSHKQVVALKEQDVEDEVKVIFKIDEGNPISVKQVEFVGNKAFGSDMLQKVLSTKPRRFLRPGDLKDDNLEADKRKLEAFYYQNGYMDFVIKEVEVKVDDQTHFNWFRKRKKFADVKITMDEGEQYYVGEIAISGMKTLTEEDLRATIKLKPGAVFSPLLLSQDRQRIQDLYGEYGRVFTQVSTAHRLVTDPKRLEKKPNLFDVEIVIREGSEVIVRDIIPRGNTKTQDKVIVRQLELAPGERIDTSKIRRAEERIKNLDYFESDVRISYEPTENPEEANLLVDVTEKNTGEFNFGVGVSSVDSVLGNISLTQRNFDYKDLPKSWKDFVSGNSFVGAGQNFSIQAQVGAKRQNYTVSFYEPWAFDRPIRLGGSIFHTVDNNFRDFNETSTGFSVTVGKRVGLYWDADLTYRFSYTTIGDTPSNLPEIFQSQEGERILSSMTPRLVFDDRDSRILPSRGWFFQTKLEVGGGPFLGSVDWIRPSIDVARYFTTYKTQSGGKHILELNGSATMIAAYGDTEEIQPFQRYFAGGVGTIRGFETRTVAPLQNGFYIGGKKMVMTTAEYSIPLYQEIVRASTFVDAGSVWDPGETPPRARITNADGLRVSYGLGLSVRTPFSPMPIRIYFSQIQTKNDEDRAKVIDFTFATKF